MKIALFSSTIDPRDGYGNITREYCMQLHAAGQSFVVFLPRSQEGKTEESFPFEIRYELPEYIFRIFQPRALKYFKATNISEFDLVHSLFAFPYCIHAAISAKKFKKPFMMGAQGTHGVRPLTYWPEKILMKRCYKSAKVITVPSEFTKQKIIEHAKEEYPITVIHNGVHFNRFQKQIDLSALKKTHEGKKVLLTVGGLWGRKGHDLVLQALEKIVQQRQDVLYVIVGDGNSREELERMVKELKLSAFVEFAGRKSGDELVSYFQVCDIYVHTPKVVDLKFEGFGIVYLEASACGKPIVATDAGGIRDAVLDGKTGLIAPDGDIDTIANHVQDLLDHPEKAEQVGKAGLEYARKNDWKSIAQQFVDLYSRVHG